MPILYENREWERMRHLLVKAVLLISGLGHDYLLTNPVLQEALLEAINTNVENMNK